jgi:hypothetical protein
LNNLKIFFFFVLSTNVVFAQIVPSFQGVYDKKSTSFSTSSSLIFDGSNDKVTTNLSMNNWSAFTFEAWVYPESTGSREGIIGHNDIIEFGFIDSNTIQLWTSRGSAINWDFSSSTLPFNTWHHIVGVGDGTANSNNLKLYINGILELQGGSAPSGDHYGTANYTLNIGAGAYDPLNSTQYYDGNLDEIRVWNSARSIDEIKANMFKQLNGDENNLQAYYKMSTATGTTLVDNSSNSNDGTITGATWGTNYVPLGDLNSSYQTDMEGLWEATGTSASQASSGLTMTVSQTLSEENFAVFGNNNTSNTSTSDLPNGTAIRSARIWQVDKSGTVSASVIIDISDATGDSPTVGAATNYKLLHRIGTSGNFTSVATGGSVSGDNITFSGVTINKGFYVIAATQSSNL